MTDAATIETMNRLLAILYRSLAMYLSNADPWTHRGDERAESVLRDLVSDQKSMSRRVASFVLEAGEQPDVGDYPMDFTDAHFLSLDFLLKRLVECQRQDVAGIEQCVAELTDPAARALAEEALGAERAHLEMLEKLVAGVDNEDKAADD